MTDGTLYIGTKRYSSWSLRGWLPVKLAGLDVTEQVIPLAGGITPAVQAVSPGGTVPYLEHQGAKLWESLAIAEYCAEFAPALWPADRVARAHARAIAGEMHAGFRELRMAMPMSLFRHGAVGKCRTEGALADVTRIMALWADTRAWFGEGGPFLFGADFTNADVMYAPVVCRLVTYQPPLTAAARAYCEAVFEHPLMQRWYNEAMREPAEWHLEKYGSRTMTGLATALDHVGVAVPDLDAAAGAWTALGFTVQPTLPHMADGRPTGTGNRTIMLGEGYIELLATIDPAKPSATIARFLAHHAGIHVLTFATDDEDAALARLTRAGFAASIARSTRPAPPAEGEAAFARIPLTDAAPRLQLLRHLTPELVWQPDFLVHPNGARALRAVIVAGDAAVAARLGRAAGVPLVPDPVGGFALRLPGGQVRVVPPEAVPALLPGAVLPALPAVLGIAVATDDPARVGQVGQAGGVTVVFTAS